MRFALFASALAASEAAAWTVPKRDASQTDLRTIKLSPSDVRQVTKAEKFALLKQGTNLIDITEHPDFDDSRSEFTTQEVAAVTYPAAVAHQDAVKALNGNLSKAEMQATLTPFTEFHNRYYDSETGVQSSAWLLKTVQDMLTASGAVNASASAFKHSFKQSSVIAVIPGLSDKTIVLGAHQDSINYIDIEEGATEETSRAPGADDDGSGSVTILEALRVLLLDEDVRAGRAKNTLEFHWYAAEEAGLLGSMDIWAAYKAANRDVKGMLQQDMTGYSKGTTDKGKPEIMGVISDYVDPDLTTFITKVIDAYCDIGYVRTLCDYACSDHASAYYKGYPSAFIFESEFGDDSPFIHSSQDTLETVNYEHMLEHAKMTVGFAYELAFADF